METADTVVSITSTTTTTAVHESVVVTVKADSAVVAAWVISSNGIIGDGFCIENWGKVHRCFVSSGAR